MRDKEVRRENNEGKWQNADIFPSTQESCAITSSNESEMKFG